MVDTQWPRYYVFDQPKEDAPHEYAGTIHAPDSEMALQNARDVFGRRPDHISLWIVPEAKILVKTREEIDSRPQISISPKGGSLESYCIFQTENHRGTSLFVGKVDAENSEEALNYALENYPNSRAVFWWVFPERAVIKTDPKDNVSLFEPAKNKIFRYAHHYPVVTLMREIEEKNAKKKGAGE